MSEHGFEPVIWRDLIEHDTRAEKEPFNFCEKKDRKEALACPCLPCSKRPDCVIECWKFDQYKTTGAPVTGEFPRLKK